MLRTRLTFRTLLVLGLLIFVVSAGLNSQQTPFCGTSNLEDIKQQMIENRVEIPRVRLRNAITYVPLKAHIMGNSEGNGKLSEDDLLDMLCKLNENFSELDIQFYFKDGFNYINNTFLYDNTDPGNSIFRAEMRAIKNKHKAINVFFKGDVGEAGVLGYYMPSPGFNDFIVVKNSVAKDKRVVTHEIGHFFSLLHPFHGWDEDPWDASKHGNPVGRLAPDNLTVNEYADGSNCDEELDASENNVGDGICDTPADYNFLSNTCNYSANAMDPVNKLVEPQVNNYMNYFSGCDQYVFTPGQQKEMMRSLLSSTRADLFSNYQPNISIIEETATLLEPIESEIVNTANEATLRWTAVENAEWYLVQIDRAPTLDFDVRSFVTNDVEIIIDGLDEERNYFWKVIPYNEYYTCASPSKVERFKTSTTTAVQEIPSINYFNVYPTLLNNKRLVTIDIQSESPFDALISVFNYQGKLLQPSQKWLLRTGANRESIDFIKYAPGLYLVQIATVEGNITTKILVQ